MENCNRCNLSKYRSHVVVGRGDFSSARVLLIGEAPGLSEDVLGTAFIGEAGKLLDEMLKDAGFDIKDCCFTNTILCRPCSSRNDIKNRPPAKEEVLKCMPNLLQIFSRLKNIELVIFVGRIAQMYFRNRFTDAKSIYLIHPSSILQNGGRGSSLHIDALNALRRAKTTHYRRL
jgi:DNA polymerase